MQNKKKSKSEPHHKPIQSVSAKRNTNWQVWLCAAVIALVTFIVFLPSLQDGFTNWDDGDYVNTNPLVTGDHVPIAEFFKTPVSGNYHPVTVLSLALNYRFGKLDPVGYHAVNILFHLFNTILVFLFIFLLTRRNLLMAVVVSLFFGIHPMHVESVTWISERKDVLYVFFFMAGLITYLKYTELKKISWYVFTMVLFVLSCLSKAMAVVFPVVLILIDYLREVKWERRSLVDKLPFFIISIVFGIVAVKTQQSGAAISAMGLFTVPQRLVFAGYGAVMYIVKFFAPVKLSAFYPYPDVYGTEGVPVLYYIFAVLFLVLAAAIIYFFRKQEKELVFGLLFYLVTVVLVLQLISVGSAIIADRYSYLSYIGLLLVVAYLINKVWQSKNGIAVALKYPVIIIVMITAALFGVQTYARTQVWNNGETLWTDAISNYGNTAVPYANRGAYYLTQNNITKALTDYDQALKFNVFSATAYRDAYYNRGLIYYNTGKNDSAFADFTKVIQIAPTFVGAYANRGNIFYDYGKYSAALADYERAIAIDANYADAYNDCGLLFYKILKDDSALIYYNKAIALNRTNATYYYNRGLEYRATNQFDKAINDFTIGIQLNPQNVMLYYNLRGVCYLALSQYSPAVADFTKAIELNPSVPDFYSNRSVAEGKMGDVVSAKSDAGMAQQLKGN